MMSTDNPITDALAGFSPTGNVIPNTWYRTILKETGKPYLYAIVILADLVYWYRPVEVRDEATGATIGYRKKFKADLVQRSYDQIAQQFGMSKRDATRAVIALENLGVVKRHLRTVRTADGTTLSNVLFLELIPARLMELTAPSNRAEADPMTDAADSNDPLSPKLVTPIAKSGDTYRQNWGDLSPKLVTPIAKSGETYTETTTETTTEITTEITTAIAACSAREEVDDNPDSSSPAPTLTEPEGTTRPQRNHIPTIKEVEEACECERLPVDAHDFYAACERRGWKDPEGEPIFDWLAYLKGWARSGGRVYDRPSGSGGQQGSCFCANTPKSRNIEDIMSFYHCKTREEAEKLIAEGLV